MARSSGVFDGEELEKLRHLLDKLDQLHFPSYEEMQALRALLASDELKAVLERERTNRLWAKIRLQFYRILGAILATLAAAGAAWTFIEMIYRRVFTQ